MEELKKVLCFNINNTIIEVFINSYNIYIFADSVEIAHTNKKSNFFSILFKDLLLKYLNNSNKENTDYLKDKNKINISLLNNKNGNFILEKIRNEIPNIEFKIKIRARNKNKSCYLLTDKEIIEGLNNIIQEVSAVEETLKICREDLMRLSLNKSFTVIWGAKEVSNKIKEILNEIVENKDWENIEFYVNILVKYIKNSIYYLSNLNKKEFDKILKDRAIPNIKESFNKIKDIVSDVSFILLKFLEFCKFIDNYTKYPTNFFIKYNLFEDLKSDYENLISFIVKIPIFERCINQLESVKD